MATNKRKASRKSNEKLCDPIQRRVTPALETADKTRAPVPRQVYDAAVRILDLGFSASSADMDQLRAWYFRGRAPGPGAEAGSVAAWALFMASDYGIIEINGNIVTRTGEKWQKS